MQTIEEQVDAVIKLIKKEFPDLQQSEQAELLGYILTVSVKA